MREWRRTEERRDLAINGQRAFTIPQLVVREEHTLIINTEDRVPDSDRILIRIKSR